jgi:hypothetical protein
LIRFERQSPHVLLQDILSRDAADPDRGGDRKGDRKADDQLHGARRQTAPRIDAAQERSSIIGIYGVSHGCKLTGD